jgi:hypothetical protein
VKWLSFPHFRVSGSSEDFPDNVVCEAWSEGAGTFTHYVGSTPGCLPMMMAIVGFIPATGSWMFATTAAIEGQVADDRGLVHRYCADEG